MASLTLLEHVHPDPDSRPGRVSPMHLGKRLLAARGRRGVTEQDAATALGIDVVGVRKLEAGDAVPRDLVTPLRDYLEVLEDDSAPAPVAAPVAPVLVEQDPAANDPAEQLRGDPPAREYPPDDVRLIERIEAARAQIGVTQADMARRLGIANTTYSAIIRLTKPLGPAVRAKIALFLAHREAEATHAERLPDDDILPLRDAFIAALVQRRISYPLVAEAIGVERQTLHNLITHPDLGVALADAQRIEAWIGAAQADPPPATPPNSAVVAAPTDAAPVLPPAPEPAPPADEGPDEEPDNDDAAAPSPPFDPLPAIVDAVHELRQERQRDQANLTIRLGVPADVRVLALLDKFPDFVDAPNGYQAQWFRSFEVLARLILAGPAESKEIA